MCLCSCAWRAPPISFLFWLCFSFCRNIFIEASEKENRFRVVDKREPGTECVYKSFKRPVKKLHRRPASAVKHKANYQLNIFRYILSCRGRRGLWSLSLFFNLCLTPFPSPLSRVVAAVGLPMTNRDEERAKHDKGSLGISFNDDRRNRKLYTPVSLSLSLSFRSFLEFRSVRDVCENQRSES